MSKFSVKKPMTVFVCVILVLILGFVSFTKMTADLLPSINLPYAIVMTTYIGASPEEVESIVTKPVEQSMATISNIKHVSSVSQENVSLVILEFNSETDMGSITVDMRESLDMLETAWTSDLIGTPMIMKLNPDMLPVMISAINIDGKNNTEISAQLSNGLLAEIESVEGVASVTVSGLVKEQINVILRDSKITSINETMAASVQEQMKSAEDQLSSAKEQLEAGRKELNAQKDLLTSQFSAYELELSTAAQDLQSKQLDLKKNELETETQKTDLQKKIDVINISQKELLSGEQALIDKETALKETEDQLSISRKELLTAEAELKQSRQEIEQGINEINNNESLDEAGKEAALAPLESALKELQTKESQLKTSQELFQVQEESFLAVQAKVQEARTSFTSSKAELELAKKTAEDGLLKIEAAETVISTSKEQLKAANDELKKKQEELAVQKETATAGLSDAELELAKGEEELAAQLTAFETAKDAALSAASMDKILTKEMISNILKAQNFSMPAGYITESGEDYLVRVGDSITDLTELQNLVLFSTGLESLEPITLSDVADVFMTDNSSEMYAKVNGSDAVILSIEKQTSYATAEVSESLQDRFASIMKADPAIHVSNLMDQGIYIDMVIDSVLSNLLYGAILAVIILLFFLKDIRPTAVIATSIPISVIFAIVLMYFSGVTLNVISLSGLAVGVGMLVDNSIVVIENIYRLRNKGYNRIQAAVLGAKQVAGAITASTLTTVCVFAPIVFVEGMTRQLFVDMALTIAYSLVASLIIALTLVPAMASGMLKEVKERKHPIMDRFTTFYEKTLRWALGHRLITLAVVLVLLVGSIFAALTNGTAYLPAMDSPQISIAVTFPQEATEEETYAFTDEIMSRIQTIPDVETVGAMSGGSLLAGLGGSSDSISMYCLLKEDKKETSFEVAEQINTLCADLSCEVNASGSAMDMSMLGGSGITLQIRGFEIPELQRIARDVAELLRNTEGTTDVSDGMSDPALEYAITVDKEKAVLSGLTVAQVFAGINGELTAAASSTSLRYQNTDYPVYVLTEAEESSLSYNELASYKFTVTGKDGTTKTVLLSDIATIQKGSGLSSIQRSDSSRYITVSAGIKEGFNIGLVSSDVDKALEGYSLPDGYSIVSSGENETINEAIFELGKMLLLAVLFIYLIMVAQFQSLLSPFIVMFTIPLAFTGGLIGLFITGNEISVISMIGFVILSGIIVNNGIVLVDYINQMRREGVAKRAALIEAGLTRIRPIMMTALTTILGLSTMALGVGMGADLVQPVAIVAIGGLIYATFTTLYVVPVLYDIFNRKPMKVVAENDLNATE